MCAAMLDADVYYFKKSFLFHLHVAEFKRFMLLLLFTRFDLVVQKQK